MQKIVLILVTLTFLSCGTVKVKFYNDSTENFKRLNIRIADKQYTFENVKSGEATRTVEVSQTYNYCYAEAMTSKDTLIFQPIDFVGERLQTWGYKDMHLTISVDENGQSRRLLFRP